MKYCRKTVESDFRIGFLVILQIAGVYEKIVLHTQLCFYALLFYLCFIFLKKEYMSISDKKIYILWGIIVVYNLTLLIRFFNISSLKYFLIQCVSFGVVVMIVQYNMSVYDFKRMGNILTAAYMIFSLWFLGEFLIGHVTGGDDTFAFGMYQLLLALSYFAVYKFGILGAVSAVLMCFLSGDRGNAVCMVGIYYIYIFFSKIKINRKLYCALYWTIVFIGTGYQFFVVWLEHSPYARIVNNVTIELTGGNFFSGRNVIWENAIKKIMENPLIGNGLHVNSFYADRNETVLLSAHNTFVQVWVSGGIVALIFFALFFYHIWKKYYDNLGDKAVRLSAAYLVGLFVISVNAVVIVGTDMQFTFYMYLDLAFGLMLCNEEKRIKEREKYEKNNACIWDKTRSNQDVSVSE